MKTAYMNGNVYVDNNHFEKGFIVEGNIFTYVGSDNDILESADKIVDLHGFTVVPGFNDSHMHFLGTGYKKTIVDLYSVKSIDELVKQLTNKEKN